MTKRLTYLDNAATTPVRPEVLEAMLPYLGKEAFGNPSSAHRFGRAARAGVEEAKRAIAEAVGAEPNQVVFTSGGTEADNLAIIGAALAARDRDGPFRVAVSAAEHKAVEAIIHGGGQQFGIRPGTENVPGIVGLATAAKLAAQEQQALAPRLRELRDELERRVLTIVPDAVINGWQGERAPHISNVSIPGTDSEALLMHLDLAGIACSSGSACSTGTVEPSHVLTAMSVPRELGVSALRFSFGRDNAAEDVDTVIGALPKIVDKVRQLSAVLHR